MAATHTKLKPLNFPLVFQNLGGCRSFSLALSIVDEPQIECMPNFFCVHTGGGNIRLQVWMLTQIQLMEIKTVSHVCLIHTHAHTLHCDRKHPSASVYRYIIIFIVIIQFQCFRFHFKPHNRSLERRRISYSLSDKRTKGDTNI